MERLDQIIEMLHSKDPNDSRLAIGILETDVNLKNQIYVMFLENKKERIGVTFWKEWVYASNSSSLSEYKQIYPNRPRLIFEDGSYLWRD